MRRKVLVIAAVIMALALGSISSKAQSRYGVIGGFSFPHASDVTNRGTMTKYNVGVTWQLKLPAGFSIQPSLMYHVKGARVGDIRGVEGNNMDLSVGYLELPVSVQWGPDLLLFRPFLDVSPYIGVGLNNSITGTVGASTVVNERNAWQTAGIARMEYGVGVGIGIEIWRFQVIGRYNWNFGTIWRAGEELDPNLSVFTGGAFHDGGNFRGLTLSLSLLF